MPKKSIPFKDAPISSQDVDSQDSPPMAPMVLFVHLGLCSFPGSCLVRKYAAPSCHEQTMDSHYSNICQQKTTLNKTINAIKNGWTWNSWISLCALTNRWFAFGLNEFQLLEFWVFWCSKTSVFGPNWWKVASIKKQDSYFNLLASLLHLYGASNQQKKQQVLKWSEKNSPKQIDGFWHKLGWMPLPVNQPWLFHIVFLHFTRPTHRQKTSLQCSIQDPSKLEKANWGFILDRRPLLIITVDGRNPAPVDR